MNAQSLRVTCSSGINIHLREWSGTEEPVCILIHGLGDSSYVWDEIAAALTPHFRVLAVDLRGHGDSDWGIENKYDCVSYCSDITDVLNYMNISEFILIGHSLGGEISIRTAFMEQKRAIGLIIVDSGPELDKDSLDYIRMNFQSSLREYKSVSDYLSFLQEARPLASRRALARLASNNLRPCSEGAFKQKCDPALANSHGYADVSGELWPMITAIKCPTLVIRGEGSAVLTPSVAQKMVLNLPDGRLNTIRIAGHSVMIDNPELCIKSFTKFLLEIKA